MLTQNTFQGWLNVLYSPMINRAGLNIGVFFQSRYGHPFSNLYILEYITKLHAFEVQHLNPNSLGFPQLKIYRNLKNHTTKLIFGLQYMIDTEKVRIIILVSMVQLWIWISVQHTLLPNDLPQPPRPGIKHM